MRFIRKYYKLLLAFVLSLCVVYYFSLPTKLFTDPYSTVVEASRGELLSAAIASDGQWRFPQRDSVNDKFAQAIVAFEDKRFWDHPGVDVRALGRAFHQNFREKKIVSGGSTLSMQVIRLSRKNRSRTVFEKIVESILATRLEIKYSKQEILSLYTAHAPFGGNVVGLEAASWRYFGRAPELISWAEAAMLAVLPNAPSLIHPGKNRVKLKHKRDKLIDRLVERQVIDAFTGQLAKAEPLPEAPHPLPMQASHLLTRMEKEGQKGKTVRSTLDLELQLRVAQILDDHHQRLKANQIYNGAILVLDVKSGKTLAYVGNTDVIEKESHGKQVDIITAPRSTGSILKPFLYAGMLDEGSLLPKTLIADVPTIINGFAPQNFSKEYDGAVSADRALIRSLNVPAIHMLKNYRYEKFHSLLKTIGIMSLKQSADHYGLALVLGGAEGTLWDITGTYASMARTLNNYFETPGRRRYRKGDFHAPLYVDMQEKEIVVEEFAPLSASSIYLTFEALKELYRPGEESGWRYFSNSKNVAWKTGTSFGFRDGWAVGVTPEYAVGVWVGNADGEGRPGLTGTDAAAPILFDVFSQLRSSSWFAKPAPEMAEISICKQSGYRVSDRCDDAEKLWVAKAGLTTLPCPYHKTIHVSVDMRFQVNSACDDIKNIKNVSWFVLPPIQEYFFKSKNTFYKLLPPYRKDCIVSDAIAGMELIYPKEHSKIFIPREMDGTFGKAVFELAHRSPATTVFWHLDGKYIGTTKDIHHFLLQPSEGKHVLTLVDEKGESIERSFEILSKM